MVPPLSIERLRFSFTSQAKTSRGQGSVHMYVTERLRKESPRSIQRGHEPQVRMEVPTVQITQ